MTALPPKTHNIAVEQLRSIVQRIEKLTEEKQALQGDISDIYAEAKGVGFDTRAIRTIVKLRKKDAQEIEEEETILDTYKAALGMIPELSDE